MPTPTPPEPEGSMRFAGVGVVSSAIFSYMLARYGVNGIFGAGKPWRMVVFIVFFALVFWADSVQWC